MDPVQRIMTQMLVAFGQGIGFGSLRISPDALDQAYADYAERIAADVDRWDALAPSVLEWAWQIGNTAAGLAVTEAAEAGEANPYGPNTVVMARHYRNARRLVLLTVAGRRPGETTPLTICECAPVRAKIEVGA